MTKKDKEEMYKLINDVRYQLLDKIDKLNRPSECVNMEPRVSSDCQRDTYRIVKRMNFEQQLERKKREIEKLEQEKTILEERIIDEKMSIAYQESNFYNN